MDKAYKSIFLRLVKELMTARLCEYKPFKLEKGSPGYEVFSGALLYRRALSKFRFVWVIWIPGPGVERYFNVELGWSIGEGRIPSTNLNREQFLVIHNAHSAVPGIAGGSLDLEQIEGRNAIGGITISSPWDGLMLVKASAPQSVQRAAQLKAYEEAAALTDNDRQVVIEKTLCDVFDRIHVQLPAFIASIEALPEVK